MILLKIFQNINDKNKTKSDVYEADSKKKHRNHQRYLQFLKFYVAYTKGFQDKFAHDIQNRNAFCCKNILFLCN